MHTSQEHVRYFFMSKIHPAIACARSLANLHTRFIGASSQSPFSIHHARHISRGTIFYIFVQFASIIIIFIIISFFELEKLVTLLSQESFYYRIHHVMSTMYVEISNSPSMCAHRAAHLLGRVRYLQIFPGHRGGKPSTKSNTTTSTCTRSCTLTTIDTYISLRALQKRMCIQCIYRR